MPDSYASWADYYQPQQSQDQQSSAPYSRMFPGIPSWMAQPWPLQPQPAQGWPQQPQQRQLSYYDSGQNTNVQARPLPYYDSGQNANAQMQQMPYVQPQQQSTDPVVEWMQQHQQQSKRKGTPAQQWEQYGLQLMGPKMPGQTSAMPYGLAPTLWANPNQGY